MSERIGILTAVNLVVPAAGGQLVDADTAVDDVVAVAADQLIGAGLRRARRFPIDDVVALAAIGQFGSVAAPR